MNIVKYYLTGNRCYQRNVKRTPIGIQLHTIGTGQGTAKDVADYWNQSAVSACVTYIVDADTEGKVLQCLPEDVRCWADGGYGNEHLITFEICESDHIQYLPNSAEYRVLDEAKFKADILRGYKNAVELCADICRRYDWNPMTKLPSGLYLISSHDEGRRAGLSTAHVDPTHVWDRFGLTMDGFRKDVADALNKNVNIKGVKIGNSNVEAISKVVYGEAGVIHSYKALLAVAQCIHDMYESGEYGETIKAVMKNNFAAYGSKETSDEARQAVYDVFINGARRFKNAKIFQFRSFTNYSDGKGHIDKDKCASLLEKYKYLGKDARDNQWGHLYFGVKIVSSNKIYVVQAGVFKKRANADAVVQKLKAAGIEAFVKHDGTYTVQAGSFDVKKNATTIAQKIKALGIEAVVK